MIYAVCIAVSVGTTFFGYKTISAYTIDAGLSVGTLSRVQTLDTAQRFSSGDWIDSVRTVEAGARAAYASIALIFQEITFGAT